MRWLLLAILLAGCKSRPAAPPQDDTLARLGHAGDIAYTLEEPGQAADQYRAELARARERDDASAIADAGFNLATAQLRANQPREALHTAQDLQAELSRRGIADKGLTLVSAAALFRLNDLPAADRMAATLTAGPPGGLADSAWFLRGLIADANNDSPLLHQSYAALSPTADPGDKAELAARIEHDPAKALHAADLRRNALDYRGMARALALAAAVTPDPAASADLYLRAGQSAAAQHDQPQAQAWLTEAKRRAPNSPLRAQADQALQSTKANP